MNIFCKKLKYGIEPNVSKDRIRLPLAIIFAYLKKITTIGSSANFLSPEPNGQGLNTMSQNRKKSFLKAVCKH